MKERKEPVAGESPHYWSLQFVCSEESTIVPATSHNTYNRQTLLPNPSQQEQSPKQSKLGILAHYIKAEQKLMLSSRQIRNTLTWKCCWTPCSLCQSRAFRQETSVTDDMSLPTIERFLGFLPIFLSMLHASQLATSLLLNGFVAHFAVFFSSAEKESAVKAKKIVEIHAISSQIMSLQR